MTDKDKIKEEIIKLKNEQLSIFSKGENDEICGTALINISVYNQLLSFIDSLPEKHNEDLEKAANQHSKKVFHGLLVEDNIAAFKAGAEWQKQQMKEALQTEYEKGRFDMREEMMKALVDGEIMKNLNNQLCVKSEPIKNTFGEYKFGNKVKILILKTEQQ